MHPCPEKMPDLQKYYKRNSSHIHGLIHLYKKICIIKLTRLLGQVQKTLSLSFSLSLFLSLSLSLTLYRSCRAPHIPNRHNSATNVVWHYSQNVDPSNKSGGPVLSRWLGYDWVWLGMIGFDWVWLGTRRCSVAQLWEVLTYLSFYHEGRRKTSKTSRNNQVLFSYQR